MLITFKKIKNKKYAKEIFNINNDPLTRKNSLNTKHFTFKKHKSWLNNVLKYKRETLYLVLIKKKIMGIIREKKKSKKFYLSWSVDRKNRGKKIGKKMLAKFIKQNKKKYFALIKTNNIPSIKICLDSGFKFLKKKDKILYFVR